MRALSGERLVRAPAGSCGASAATARTGRPRADLSAPEALAPDMSSNDVRFAEADVDLSHANPAKMPEPVKVAAKAFPKKRKVHIVAKPKENEQDGLQAMLSASRPSNA